MASSPNATRTTPPYTVTSYSSGRKILTMNIGSSTITTFPSLIKANPSDEPDVSEPKDEDASSSDEDPDPECGLAYRTYFPEADWFEALPPVVPPVYHLTERPERGEDFALPTNLEENRRQWRGVFTPDLLAFFAELRWPQLRDRARREAAGQPAEQAADETRRIQVKTYLVSMSRVLLAVRGGVVGWNRPLLRALLDKEEDAASLAVLNAFFDRVQKLREGGTWREIHLSVGAMRGALEMRGWIIRRTGSGVMPRAGLLAEEYFALPTTGPLLRKIASDGASLVRQCFPEPEKVTKKHFQIHFAMQSDAIWDQARDAMVADGVWGALVAGFLWSNGSARAELTAQTEGMLQFAPPDRKAALLARVDGAGRVSVGAALVGRIVYLARNGEESVPVVPLTTTIPPHERTGLAYCSDAHDRHSTVTPGSAVENLLVFHRRLRQSSLDTSYPGEDPLTAELDRVAYYFSILVRDGLKTLVDDAWDEYVGSDTLDASLAKALHSADARERRDPGGMDRTLLAFGTGGTRSGYFSVREYGVPTVAVSQTATRVVVQGGGLSGQNQPEDPAGSSLSTGQPGSEEPGFEWVEPTDSSVELSVSGDEDGSEDEDGDETEGEDASENEPVHSVFDSSLQSGFSLEGLRQAKLSFHKDLMHVRTGSPDFNLVGCCKHALLVISSATVSPTSDVDEYPPYSLAHAESLICRVLLVIRARFPGVAHAMTRRQLLRILFDTVALSMAIRTPGLAMLYAESCLLALGLEDDWAVSTILADLAGISLCLLKASTRGFRDAQHQLGPVCRSMLRDDHPRISPVIDPASIRRMIEIQGSVCGGSLRENLHSRETVEVNQERPGEHIVSIQQCTIWEHWLVRPRGVPVFPSFSAPWLLFTLPYSREIVTALSRWCALVEAPLSASGLSEYVGQPLLVLDPPTASPTVVADTTAEQAEYGQDVLAGVQPLSAPTAAAAPGVSTTETLDPSGWQGLDDSVSPAPPAQGMTFETSLESGGGGEGTGVLDLGRSPLSLRRPGVRRHRLLARGRQFLDTLNPSRRIRTEPSGATEAADNQPSEAGPSSRTRSLQARVSAVLPGTFSAWKGKAKARQGEESALPLPATATFSASVAEGKGKARATEEEEQQQPE